MLVEATQAGAARLVAAAAILEVWAPSAEKADVPAVTEHSVEAATPEAVGGRTAVAFPEAAAVIAQKTHGRQDLLKTEFRPSDNNVLDSKQRQDSPNQRHTPCSSPAHPGQDRRRQR